MLKKNQVIYSSIMVSLLTMVLFSCSNDVKEVRDFLAEKNLPIGVASDAFHVYKDSGIITSKLITPLMHDFSNRKNHPYSEFPNGVKIVNFENEIDSVTITGDYAITYNKTSVSEIKGNVIVLNHKEQSVLKTEQLFWDRKNKYFVSERKFDLITADSTHVIGTGFECQEDFSKWISKKIHGDLVTKDNDI